MFDSSSPSRLLFFADRNRYHSALWLADSSPKPLNVFEEATTPIHTLQTEPDNHGVVSSAAVVFFESQSPIKQNFHIEPVSMM